MLAHAWSIIHLQLFTLCNESTSNMNGCWWIRLHARIHTALLFLNHTLWRSKGVKIHDKYRVTYVRDIRVIDLFCSHSLSSQCVPLLQLGQSQEATQGLCVEAGQSMWWILLHPAGHNIIKMSGSTEIFQNRRDRLMPKLGQLLFSQIFYYVYFFSLDFLFHPNLEF